MIFSFTVGKTYHSAEDFEYICTKISPRRVYFTRKAVNYDPMKGISIGFAAKEVSGRRDCSSNGHEYAIIGTDDFIHSADEVKE